MAIDAGILRTRRALLAGGIGGLVALVASAVGRPLQVKAGSDGDVVLGARNGTDTATVISIVDRRSSDPAIIGDSIDGAGVIGYSWSSNGVEGFGAGGCGVYGSGDAYGLRGEGGRSGVFGLSGSGVGVAGQSSDGETAGILGFSGAGTPPAAPAKTGVFGYAVQDASARGVHGYSTTGRGVFGEATAGSGVRGYATTGTAVYAASADPRSGYALQAIGRVKLDNCSGLATIAAGTKSVVVTPGIDLTTSSAVVATLQASAGGTTTVHRCVVNGPANTFTIYLTANSTTNVKVAWHVFG